MFVQEKIKRLHPSSQEGLSEKEVFSQKSLGLANEVLDDGSKSVKEIVKNNVFTLFNIINIILAVAIIAVGSYKNLTFMGIIILNTLISIVQELRSKHALDKLKVVSNSKVEVIRDSNRCSIDIADIVLDDIILYQLGSQVVVDAFVLEGEVLVNESFITGEEENIVKKKGDLLLSGSFIVGGKAICQVEHVGLDNYTAKISNGTKYLKPVSSEIMRSLNKIVKTISFLIIPVGILLFAKQLYLDGNTLENAVVSTVAALIGMIPEGLVLLTSTVLAVSVVRLSRKKVLVQDLYCIETLARVDTICLDKTGTITEGSMEVVDVISCDGNDYSEIIGSIVYSLDEENPTALALKNYFPKKKKWKVVEKIPFSSSKKYSGVIFEEGAFYIGAVEFVLKNGFKKYKKEIEEYSENYRVVVLAEDRGESKKEALAFVLLQDKIRESAPATLEYFKKQGVDIKIISGDNPITVLNIARRAGLDPDSLAVDATTLKSEQDIVEAVSKYTVFGRVAPLQKQDFVIALQNQGHVVAMTGDGVNDVLALKEADCSVAMASGSDATKNVSQLVLLNSDFKAMPEIVAEGRRTINNIQRSASLFLVKTIYATLLSFVFLFIDMPYPFIPIQLTLTSVVTIGIPSFILALEPNKDLVKGKFLPNVLKKALPPAFTIVLNILVIFIASNMCTLTTKEISTLSVIVTGYTSFILLYKVCSPFNLLRKVLFVLMFSTFIFGLIIFKELFAFADLDFLMCIIIVTCMVLSHAIYALVEDTVHNVLNYWKRHRKVTSP